MESKIILTTEDVGVWAFHKFEVQEKMIKSLKLANKRLVVAVLLLAVAGYETYQFAHKNLKRQAGAINDIIGRVNAIEKGAAKK